MTDTIIGAVGVPQAALWLVVASIVVSAISLAVVAWHIPEMIDVASSGIESIDQLTTALQEADI